MLVPTSRELEQAYEWLRAHGGVGQPMEPVLHYGGIQGLLGAFMDGAKTQMEGVNMEALAPLVAAVLNTGLHLGIEVGEARYRHRGHRHPLTRRIKGKS